MLKLLYENSGYSYLILSKTSPVLRKHYSAPHWELYTPNAHFWLNIPSLEQGQLTVDQEALYDEICVLR